VPFFRFDLLKHHWVEPDKFVLITCVLKAHNYVKVWGNVMGLDLNHLAGFAYVSVVLSENPPVGTRP